MKPALQAMLTQWLRLVLVLALACSPLSQPLALASLMAAQQSHQAAPAQPAACPHHASQANPAADSVSEADPGACCVMQGSACHCAMAVCLLTPPLPTLGPAVSEHPVSAPRLTSLQPASPEPPPPRA